MSAQLGIESEIRVFGNDLTTRGIRCVSDVPDIHLIRFIPEREWSTTLLVSGNPDYSFLDRLRARRCEEAYSFVLITWIPIK